MPGLVALVACSTSREATPFLCTEPHDFAGPVSVSQETPLGTVNDWHTLLTSTSRTLVVADSSEPSLVGEAMSLSFELTVVEEPSQVPMTPCDGVGCDTIWLPRVSVAGAGCEPWLYFLEHGHAALDGADIEGFFQVSVMNPDDVYPALALVSDEQRVTVPEGHRLAFLMSSLPLNATMDARSGGAVRLRLFGLGPTAPWVELELTE